MVNFKKLADKAKDVVEKRGGTDSLKEDANQLKNIAKGKGSLKDKAMKAKDAIKEPGGGEKAHRGAEHGGRPREGENVKPGPEASPEAEERHGGGPAGT